jgi:hypothetical protein
MQQLRHFVTLCNICTSPPRVVEQLIKLWLQFQLATREGGGASAGAFDLLKTGERVEGDCPEKKWFWF